MKKTLKRMMVMVTLSLCAQSYAAVEGVVVVTRPLADRLSDVVAGFPSSAVSSIMVRDAKTGEVLYERFSRQNLMPASVQKVSTAIAAYDRLGLDFRFSTQLLASQPLAGSGLLKGGVQLLFNGDPSLTRDNLEALLGSLTKKGVRQVEGTLWLDGSAYEGYPNAEGVAWNDLKICFAAPSTAMILDRNCFYALLKPAKLAGRKAVIEYAKPDWPFRLVNEVITSGKESKKCEAKSWESEETSYRLTGCIAKDSTPLRMAFSVKQPEQTIKRFVEKTLRKKGILHKGQVVIGKPDKQFGNKLAEHYSESLSELLVFMLETSDNLYADSILKTLGRGNQQQAGSYGNGVEALISIFQSLGVNMANNHVEDGSGLSRYNLVSAATVSNVLLAGWKKWGTDMPWLQGKHQEYWYKTGTMQDARAIAGYAFPDNGVPKVFVILLNGLVPENGSSVEEVKRFWIDVRANQQAFIQELFNK